MSSSASVLGWRESTGHTRLVWAVTGHEDAITFVEVPAVHSVTQTAPFGLVERRGSGGRCHRGDRPEPDIRVKLSFSQLDPHLPTNVMRELRVLLYPSAITLSTTHLRYVADLLRAHLRRIGSPWRKLTPTRQALLVLAHLRNGDTYQRLATGFGIGVATVYRYVREVTDLLAAHAPSLTAAVWRLAWTHNNFAILDGTVVRIDRIAADRPFYSGKHRHHGINLQGLTDPYGNLAWISDGLPGSVNDTAAARHHHILDVCVEAGLLLLADTGYHNITDTPTTHHTATVITPYKNSRNQHTTGSGGLVWPHRGRFEVAPPQGWSGVLGGLMWPHRVGDVMITGPWSGGLGGRSAIGTVRGDPQGCPAGLSNFRLWRTFGGGVVGPRQSRSLGLS